MMLQINQMKLNVLAEQQGQSQASSGLGDKGASKEKAGAVHDFMKKTVNIMSGDILTVTADSNQQAKSKSLCHMETLLTLESQTLEVDDSKHKNTVCYSFNPWLEL